MEPTIPCDGPRDGRAGEGRGAMTPSRKAGGKAGVGALALAVVLASGACGSRDPGASSSCPDVAVLADGERLVLFKAGPGRGVADVAIAADISNLRSTCDYGGGSVEVETSFEIVSTRGPEADVDAAAVEFFAAVVDPEGRVIAKETFESRAGFPAGSRRVAVEEVVTQRIPVSGPDAGRRHQVLIGFQLTPEQLEYNRSGR